MVQLTKLSSVCISAAGDECYLGKVTYKAKHVQDPAVVGETGGILWCLATWEQ